MDDIPREISGDLRNSVRADALTDATVAHSPAPERNGDGTPKENFANG